MKSSKPEVTEGAEPGSSLGTVRVLAACAVLGGCAAGVMQAEAPPESAAPAAAPAVASKLLAEGVYNERTFSKEGFAILEANNSLADIITRNTGITNKDDVGFKIR